DREPGKPYCSVPYNAHNGGVIITPVAIAGHVFLGGINNRNLLATLAAHKPGASAVWKDKARHGVSPIDVQPIADGDVIYGAGQSGRLMTAKVPSGERLWQTSQPIGTRPVNSGTAFLIRNDNRYFILVETGDLVIGKLSPKGFEELD